jgi:hypothetical protein
MKLTKKLGIAALLIGLTSTPLFASDYSSMSIDELANIRGTLFNATIVERNEFRNEWQKRIQSMTFEERQQYMGRPSNASFAKGQGRQGKMGYGQMNQMGNGNSKGYGRGNKGQGRGYNNSNTARNQSNR